MAEQDKLNAAIEPFRKWAECWGDEADERVAYSVRYDGQEIVITVGDLRALIDQPQEPESR